MSGGADLPEIRVVPANEASWPDLQAIFGTRGDTARCQCQHYKARDMEWRSIPLEERAHRLREQTDCGHPESGATSGLVAYLDDFDETARGSLTASKLTLVDLVGMAGFEPATPCSQSWLGAVLVGVVSCGLVAPGVAELG